MTDYLDFYKGKIVLVTGGAGAIGSNLTRTISDLGAKLVIILDDLSASYEWNIPQRENIIFIKGSVTDNVCLKKAFSENPSHVFHLAAFFANQNSVEHPHKDLEVNGTGILNVLEHSKAANVGRFVYASSGCSIYGSQAPLPLKEEFMSLNLTTPYQITKMLGELYCNFFTNQYDVKCVKTRFFNSYGPGEVPGRYRNVIPNFIYWAMKGEALPITGNKEATRDFTYVEDLVDGLLRAGYYEQAVGKEMNLASAREIKIGELAIMINELVGNTSGIKMAAKRRWDTKSRLLASIDRAKELTGYAPKMKFEDGLKKTIEWFKNNWSDIESSAAFPKETPASSKETPAVVP
jgi:UDP-glucose 4-epimerase